MTSPPPPQSNDQWQNERILVIDAKLDALDRKVSMLMTQSENLAADIAELKTNVAAIQQVIDALAAASQNATELSDLRAAVTQAHADLQTLNANLKADDPAAPPTP